MKNVKTRAALISVFSNSILIILKLCAGILSGSVSIISEAIHSGMDLIASFIALFSVTVSSKPPDKQHPYGHGKIENISGTLEGLLILIAAVFIISEAVKKLANPHPLNETTIAIAVMFFSAIVNWFVSSYLYKVAKQEDSVALEADALHLRTDVYTSAGVGFGIILINITGFVLLDPLVAIFVASLILKESYKLCRRAFNPLMDTKLPEGEEHKIIEILQKYCNQLQIHGYHDLKTRQSGSQRYAEFHLEVDPTLSIKEYQRLSDGIQDDLHYSFDNICITIHVETRSF